jgi:hypothetical protein
MSWTPSISSTRAGGSPSKIKGPLVAKYQLVDLLEYSVSTLKGSKSDLLVGFLKQEIVLGGYIMSRNQ